MYKGYCWGMFIVSIVVIFFSGLRMLISFLVFDILVFERVIMFFMFFLIFLWLKVVKIVGCCFKYLFIIIKFEFYLVFMF